MAPGANPTVLLNGVTLSTNGDDLSTAFDGLITGTGALTKLGTGTLTLNGLDEAVGTNNVEGGTLLVNGSITSTGGVVVSTGEVEPGNSDALSTVEVTVDVNLGLDLIAVSSATLGSLAGSGNIDLLDRSLIVGKDNDSATYSGDFSNSSGGSITKIGTAGWELSGDSSTYHSGVTIDDGSIVLDSDDALFGSTIDVETTGTGLTTGSGLPATTIGGLTGPGGFEFDATEVTVGVDNADTTYSGEMFGSATFNKDGTGTLTLTGADDSAGGTVVIDGTLAVSADAALSSGGVTVDDIADLEFVENVNTNKTFTLDGGTILVDAGKLLGFFGDTVTGPSTSFHGWLDGSGTFASFGAVFTHISSTPSVTIDSHSVDDQFIDFDNSATFNIAGDLNTDDSSTTEVFNGFTDEGLGSITIGAYSHVEVADFHTYGVLTIDPADVGSGYHTLLTNTGSSDLDFNAGSRTFIGTAATANYMGSPAFVDGIDLHGHQAHVLEGLLVNNGFVADSVSPGTATVISDGVNPVTSAPALVKGAGFFQSNVITENGGQFLAGNSPGTDHLGQLTFGPGGTSNYLFEIDDATGTAGPSPDSEGHVDLWSLANASDLSWTADSTHKLAINLRTLVNPTTVGTDVSGSMANFDPTQSYVWAAVHWTGTYTGPTDVAALNDATDFDTSGFVNSFNGTFSWQLDTVNQTLSIVYTPN